MKVLIYGMSELHGGVESFIYNYASNFSDDVQVDYITDYDSIPFEKEFRESGSRIYSLPSRRKHYLQYKKELNAIFTNNHYDVVWANVCSLSSIDVLSVAKKMGVPKRIVHSHNSHNMSGFITGILHGINKKRIEDIATDFWACSAHAGEWMFPSGISDVKVVNNAINTKLFSFNPEVRKQTRTDLGIDTNFVVGHVGRFHYQKNHELLINIFYELLALKPEAKLVLVGSGELENEIVDQIANLKIQDSVLILGQRNDIPDLLQAFDVFLLPSRFEGLPFVLVEAQASGLVSFTSKDVVSDQSKISEILHFIELSKSPKEWAEEVLENYTPRVDTTNDIINAGFDIATEASKVEKLFNNGK